MGLCQDHTSNGKKLGVKSLQTAAAGQGQYGHEHLKGTIII
jgi:hypothetical protein